MQPELVSEFGGANVGLCAEFLSNDLVAKYVKGQWDRAQRFGIRALLILAEAAANKVWQHAQVIFEREGIAVSQRQTDAILGTGSDDPRSPKGKGAVKIPVILAPCSRSCAIGWK